MDICNAAKGIGKLYLLMLCKKKQDITFPLMIKNRLILQQLICKCNQVLAMINATLLFK